MLNSSTVDVDKLDYITRDTQMSGFDNVPIDIERLVKSVTAIKEKDGWIYPAFRKNALSVIDNVFRAKIEQSLWMVSHPVVLYDSELLSFCINSLNNCIGKDYVEKVFSFEALGNKGTEYNKKTYRLLSDIDINSDLKAYCRDNELMGELYERGMRRHPIWKSYYEYKYLFNNEKVGEESIFLYFKGLIDYIKSSESFVLDEELYLNLKKDTLAPAAVTEAAEFLWNFCNKNKIEFNFVILLSSNTFAPSFDPNRVFISFRNLPYRGKCNYVTYKFLKGDIAASDSKRFFYIYSKKKFSAEQIQKLRDSIVRKINDNEKKKLRLKEKIKERA
ncbi:MAG TPA: hypothetical protein VHP38_14450 [Ruminiclostridium sp.]|nr:hypothetical protein [Ruminiclostridium sp.]